MFLVCLRASVWGGWNISGMVLLSILCAKENSNQVACCGRYKVFLWVVPRHLMNRQVSRHCCSVRQGACDDLSTLNWLICTVRFLRHSSQTLSSCDLCVFMRNQRSCTISDISFFFFFFNHFKYSSFKFHLAWVVTHAGFSLGLIILFSSVFKRIVLKSIP